MKQAINAVLFDMDGVLVDSEAIMLLGAQEALSEWGIKAIPSDFVPFIGAGEDRFVGGVAELHGVPYVKDMKKRAYERYAYHAAHTDIVIPGAADMLRELIAGGVKIALCSSADWVKVEINIRALGLTPDDFGAVLTGESVERKKPFPDIYLAGAKALDVDPSACVVVEDAVNGILAGHAAGAKVIGVTTSFTREQLIDRANPEWIIGSIADVAEIVL
ncbi:MAG: HAD-IA family hydrolase [Clostridiaceae bacterium]|nr:HAD-IA family hydrolase [Clostridiaceae bacterium]